MSSPGDFNARIIEEFRANQGRVGPPFEGAPLLLLHTTGARSGQPRVSPVMYQEGEERLYVFASKGGAPEHPAWFHNLVAHPDVTVELGTETFAARAHVLDGAERDRVFRRQVELRPTFGEYEEKVGDRRTIPVVALERV